MHGPASDKLTPIPKQFRQPVKGPALSNAAVKLKDAVDYYTKTAIAAGGRPALAGPDSLRPLLVKSALQHRLRSY